MSKEAMKLALEALEAIGNGTEFWDVYPPDHPYGLAKTAITALREALAEQPAQQEPVSLEDSLKESKVCCGDYANCHRACTPRGRWEALRLVETAQPAQPSKPWVGLTDEELEVIANECRLYPRDFARAIEAKLREKNHG